MRMLSVLLLMFASSAFAQSPPSIDCGAVKNSTVSVELAYHGRDGTKTIVQAHRDGSGDHVVWTRQILPSTQLTPPVLVTKAIWVDGLPASAEFSTTYAGKYSYRTATYTSVGLPRNFDRRSDLTYSLHAVITSADNSIEERTSTFAYKFKSEGTTTVGSCVLQVIHGEADTNDGARTRHTFQLYFPELKISAMATDAEPVVDDLSTVFLEIKPVNK